MVDPSPSGRIRRQAADAKCWHRSRGQDCWMTLPGMYGVIHARRDPGANKWIAWVRNGEHNYPPCTAQRTRIAAAVNAVQIAIAHGFRDDPRSSVGRQELQVSRQGHGLNSGRVQTVP